jgi:hypothetical protein
MALPTEFVLTKPKISLDSGIDSQRQASDVVFGIKIVG